MPRPDWSPESGSLGQVTGPHNKPFLGDLCAEHRALVIPQISDLEILVAVLMGNMDAESY